MTLLDEVKEEIKVTWDDEDARLQRMIERAKTYLNDLAGAKLNFEEEGVPKDLLLARCRYVYNNAAEYFEDNFQSDIVRLQYQVGIQEMLKAGDDDAK